MIMLFKDCKQGYPVYLFDRKDVSIKTGKVTNSPLPHLDSKCPTMGKMVVDLNVEANGATTAYVLEDSAEVGYAGNLVISCNRESITREIESLKSQSEEALKMNDYYKEAVTKCNQLLKDFSPEYKQRTEDSERISGLEHKVDVLSDAVTALINKLEKGGAR